MSKRCGWCATMLLAVGFAAPAAAQDLERARAVFDEAQRQFEAENYQLALDGFERSRELAAGDDRAQALLLFNIGRAQEELGRYRDAERTFSRFLSDAPSDAPYREETLDRVRELRARLAAEEPDQPPLEEDAAASDSPLIPVGVAALAVGGAALVAAVPLGVVALDGSSTLEQRCPGGDCPASEAGLIDETRTLSVATDVLWIAGLSVAAVGGVLLGVGAVSSSGSGQVEATGICAPTLGCTMGMQGSF